MAVKTSQRRRKLASTAKRGYDAEHQAERRRWEAIVVAGKADCVRCGRPIQSGEPFDLGHDEDRRHHGPEHRRCNRGAPHRKPRSWEQRKPVPAAPVEPAGLPARDEVWKVPWLTGLRRVPKGAVWPRLMTVPHPRATGSLGWEFIEWAEARSGKPLRWWQRLVAVRLLEVDQAGVLVWDTLVLSMARQLGKSWLLRELLLWRIHQGERFGEPQDVLHTGKDVAICTEVQRPARFWARAQPELFKVREVNGQEMIELLADRSRWMVRAKGAPYGHSVSMVAVDEAWNVRQDHLDSGAAPTMVERAQPQLLLISTAHREATSLMTRSRRAAFEHLHDGEGDLLIEWSAPRELNLEDTTGWKLASPHWSPQRERMIGRQLEGLRTGEIIDPDEKDPLEAFRAQWLNQWPVKKPDSPDGEELLPPAQWAALGESGCSSTGDVWVAVEDDFGLGAAVAAVGITGDGRIEMDGWRCRDWDTALADVSRLGDVRRIRQLLVGANLLSRVPPGTSPPPRPVGTRELRPGLALLRDLAANGGLVHDQTRFQLEDAILQARVKEQATGLQLMLQGPSHLVRALVWAVQAAHKPAPVPAIL